MLAPDFGMPFQIIISSLPFFSALRLATRLACPTPCFSLRYIVNDTIIADSYTAVDSHISLRSTPLLHVVCIVMP
jgi:hypothetical protein